jgi:hypothetical protein
MMAGSCEPSDQAVVEQHKGPRDCMTVPGAQMQTGRGAARSAARARAGWLSGARPLI